MIREGRMTDQHTADPQTPDPVELAKTMAGIAERSQRLLVEFLNRQARGEGMENADPLNIGSAFLALTARMMAEPAKLFEAQVAEWNKLFTSALDKAAQSAPAGSGPVFAAVKSALGAANTAYDNISKATKQVTEAAEANIAAATEATVKAASAKKSA